jgi:hypothetical protein
MLTNYKYRIGYDNTDWSAVRLDYFGLKFIRGLLQNSMPHDLSNVIDRMPNHVPISDLYFYWRVTPGTGEYIPVAKLLTATDEVKFASWAAYTNWECGHV